MKTIIAMCVLALASVATAAQLHFGVECSGQPNGVWASASASVQFNKTTGKVELFDARTVCSTDRPTLDGNVAACFCPASFTCGIDATITESSVQGQCVSAAPGTVLSTSVEKVRKNKGNGKR